MKARVVVTLKSAVLDPQGKAIENAISALGVTGVGSVRQGRYFELDVVAESAESARNTVDDVCAKLLANPVIEDYRFDLEDDG